MLPDFIEEIHIENTNACGYKCVMCPREKQTRKLGHMSLEDFEMILERVGDFSGLVHLHGYGEPLLDRQLIAKVERLSAPSMIISTLGVRVKEDYFDKLLGAGLDNIMISCYGYTAEEYQQAHGFDGFALMKKNLAMLGDALQRHPTQATIKITGTNLASNLPLAPDPHKAHFTSWAESLGFQIGELSYLHNYSDGRSYNAPSDKLCPVISGLRKSILNITWDLNVIPCCYDYDAKIVFGNLRTQTPEEIFASEPYLNFVLSHSLGQLERYPICQTCEKHDYVVT